MDARFTSRPRASGPDGLIAEIAARQRGVVTRQQLLSAGLGRGAITARIGSGRLHRVHAGVYLVGHAVAPRWALEMAAVLACGPRAVLSHHSAARVWGLARPSRGPVDVTVVGRQAPRRPGIRTWASSALLASEVAHRLDIPITAPARTVLDLAGLLHLDDLEDVVAKAYDLRLTGEGELRRQLERRRGGRGTRALRLLLERDAGPALTRSEAERLFLRLVRETGLPEPEVNARVGSYEVDFLWHDAMVVVEIDGYAFHSGRRPFERDRDRTNDLQLQGYTVLRFTWRQLVDVPGVVSARLRRALRPRPSP